MITKFKDLQHQRVYIGNFIRRHYTGSRKCVNCGKEPTTIVHNKKDPYKISFICDDCRLGLDEEQLASLKKISLLDYVDNNQKYSPIKNITLTEDLKNILEGILKTDLPLLTYLKENNISSYRYNKILDLYEKEVGPIKDKIKQHLKEQRINRISKSMKIVKSKQKTNHEN